MPNSFAIDELATAAFEVLLLHPGITRDGWIDTLMEQYSIEVIDAYGTNPHVTKKALLALWSHPYTDLATGATLTYDRWATLFSDSDFLEQYYTTIKSNTI